MGNRFSGCFLEKYRSPAKRVPVVVSPWETGLGASSDHDCKLFAGFGLAGVASYACELTDDDRYPCSFTDKGCKTTIASANNPQTSTSLRNHLTTLCIVEFFSFQKILLYFIVKLLFMTDLTSLPNFVAPPRPRVSNLERKSFFNKAPSKTTYLPPSLPSEPFKLDVTMVFPMTKASP